MSAWECTLQSHVFGFQLWSLFGDVVGHWKVENGICIILRDMRKHPSVSAITVKIIPNVYPKNPSVLWNLEQKKSCCSPNCSCRVFVTKTNQPTLWVKLKVITFLKFKQNFPTLPSSWACIPGTLVVWRSWKKLTSCWLDVSLFHNIPITILYKNVWLDRKYTLERKPTPFFFLLNWHNIKPTPKDITIPVN